MVEEVTSNVVLLQAPGDGGFSMSAKAAKFCTNADNIKTIMADNSTDEKVLNNVINYGHLAVLRFDWWVFGIEDVSRTFTHQLVRKTSGVCFAQESMRYTSQDGTYKIIIPETLKDKTTTVLITGESFSISLADLADISHQFYEGMQNQGVPNEDARFGLLESSKTKIMFGGNSQALLDFFAERTCSCAQWEIRKVAIEILRICKNHSPIEFKNAGPKCIKAGYCTEALNKWKKCQYRPHKNNPLTKQQIKDKIDKLTKQLGEM